jgi:5'-3' exonuclease
MHIHLLDGTYELFRGFYGPPPKTAPDGREVGATVALLRSLMALLAEPAVTHLAVAFDSVVESFRNDMLESYKDGAGIDPKLKEQFPLAEEAVAALGIVVWPMVEFEADDAIATAAIRFKDDPDVEQVIVCSPDKDLAQLVEDNKVVCWDRRREIVYDEAGVISKYGVPPDSIPDYLGLVGDAADGIPGVPAWGAKTAATLLTKFGHIEGIPEDIETWGMGGRAKRLKANLDQHRDLARLYRELATLQTDVPLKEKLADLEWRGARAEFRAFCETVGTPDLAERVTRWL